MKCLQTNGNSLGEDDQEFTGDFKSSFVDRIFWGDYDYDNETAADYDVNDICQCGSTSLQKVIGGVDATPNEFPWMVFLKIEGIMGKFACGGSLLTDRHILTAAHCAVPGLLGRITANIGDHDISKSNETESQQRQVSQIRVHPRYSLGALFNNDFAVLTLAKPVVFNDHIKPICLPSSTRQYDNEDVHLAGWGRTIPGGSGADVLQKANLKVVSRQQCRAAYRNVAAARITPYMICAGTPDGSQDACQGDSGGPLMHKMSGQSYQIGVVSFSAGCAREGVPAVYARVDRVLPWIRREIHSGNVCL